MDITDLYLPALEFAAEKHKGQTLKHNDLPYMIHLVSVATSVLSASYVSENFDVGFAVQVAYLHDTLEDTDTTYNEIRERFSERIAESVLALTKFKNIPKEDRLEDSLRRILKMEKEVWAVKLADRLSNLQPPPPDWDSEKIRNYHRDAILIYDLLKDGNVFLAEQLSQKISRYSRFIHLVDNSVSHYR